MSEMRFLGDASFRSRWQSARAAITHRSRLVCCRRSPAIGGRTCRELVLADACLRRVPRPDQKASRRSLIAHPSNEKRAAANRENGDRRQSYTRSADGLSRR